ncbi:MAG: hypothetical protein PHE43_03460 [Candidatus Nanoarchaeia archaeon]|nr:hypothetical protein [Candidatus Nanoarchaeia archaeon]
MKKGESHADWAISMGIFLVAVMSVLMFLRPGFTPEYKQDVLSSIIEEGIKNDIRVNVEKIPIYIDIIVEPFESKKYSLEFPVTNFPVDDSNEYFKMVNDQNEIIDFSITGMEKNRNIAFAGYLSSNSLNIFYIIHMTKISVTNTDPGEQSIADSSYDLIIGTVARNSGVYSLLLEDLENTCKTSEGYKSLKEKWGYPPNKEFEIYVDGNKICNQAEPSTNVDIFVKEWKDVIVDNTGIDYKTVQFNIRTW